ncbi:GNAT family N-acetyltransferase [Agromyces lapidis]|uniref:GNAT family N-acetyltransferase n=1 Tax=Agromyces lapidis TaxID=279574 RepID=A0ABV5SU88_9MICO|nr:GNAT family N-acetyltransferase [Agromyces lapidis]
MVTVTVRTMAPVEYADWQRDLAEAYADEQVTAGRWPREGAVQRALDENAAALPQGVDTPRMLVLRGVDAAGEPVGRAWVGLDHPRGAPDVAFLYDIEIVEERRGSGLGRALLAAVEEAVRQAGVGALELNVFGPNAVAISLYDSAGYVVTTQQMRKSL